VIHYSLNSPGRCLKIIDTLRSKVAGPQRQLRNAQSRLSSENSVSHFNLPGSSDTIFEVHLSVCKPSVL
jgi:hypothetical protein